jgi:hypothetical protein
LNATLLEWRKIHRKNKIMEALNHACIHRGDTDLASPGVSNENNKCKILKDPLANYQSHV